jgi:hypothetical protein
MNIFFPYELAMYVVFLDWPKVGEWLVKNRLLDRWRLRGGLFVVYRSNFPTFR